MGSLTTVPLGSTDLSITRAGVGAWAIGGAGWDWGWGSQDDDESIAAIHRALELIPSFPAPRLELTNEDVAELQGS